VSPKNDALGFEANIQPIKNNPITYTELKLNKVISLLFILFRRCPTRVAPPMGMIMELRYGTSGSKSSNGRLTKVAMTPK
jgi:hypothetical protein